MSANEEAINQEVEPYGREIGQRVYVRLWWGLKRLILLVLNKEAVLPNGDKRDTGWGIPGGGMKEGEDPRDAALREVEEEVGKKIAEAIKDKMVYIKAIRKWSRDRDGKPVVGGNYITHHLFEAEIDEVIEAECGKDPVEIVTEAKWIEPQDLYKTTPHQKIFLKSETYSENGRNSFRVYQAAIDLVMSAK